MMNMNSFHCLFRMLLHLNTFNKLLFNSVVLTEHQIIKMNYAGKLQ